MYPYSQHPTTVLDSSLKQVYIRSIAAILISTYCAQATALKNWMDFAGNISATQPVSYGIETGITDLLTGKTAVSIYITEISGNIQAITTVIVGGLNINYFGHFNHHTIYINEEIFGKPNATPAASSTGGASSFKVIVLLELSMVWVKLDNIDTVG